MDLFILTTDVEKFTSTNKKTLHLIFKNWDWSESWFASLCPAPVLLLMHLVSTVSSVNELWAVQPGTIQHALNDLIAGTLASSGTLASHRVCYSQMTLIRWEAGKAMWWDVTVVSPLAASYVAAVARDAGAANCAVLDSLLWWNYLQAYYNTKSLTFHQNIESVISANINC